MGSLRGEWCRCRCCFECVQSRDNLLGKLTSARNFLGDIPRPAAVHCFGARVGPADIGFRMTLYEEITAFFDDEEAAGAFPEFVFHLRFSFPHMTGVVVVLFVDGRQAREGQLPFPVFEFAPAATLTCLDGREPVASMGRENFSNAV